MGSLTQGHTFCTRNLSRHRSLSWGESNKLVSLNFLPDKCFHSFKFSSVASGILIIVSFRNDNPLFRTSPLYRTSITRPLSMVSRNILPGHLLPGETFSISTVLVPGSFKERSELRTNTEVNPLGFGFWVDYIRHCPPGGPVCHPDFPYLLPIPCCFALTFRTAEIWTLLERTDFPRRFYSGLAMLYTVNVTSVLFPTVSSYTFVSLLLNRVSTLHFSKITSYRMTNLKLTISVSVSFHPSFHKTRPWSPGSDALVSMYRTYYPYIRVFT